jgi:endogenous inhibitor of DNA gyrase (YacG/DUF329 family)
MKPSISPPTCAICGRPQAADYRPFCSRRCADVDLQRWLSGGYVVPAEASEPQDGPPSVQTDGEE